MHTAPSLNNIHEEMLRYASAEFCSRPVASTSGPFGVQIQSPQDDPPMPLRVILRGRGVSCFDQKQQQRAPCQICLMDWACLSIISRYQGGCCICHACPCPTGWQPMPANDPREPILREIQVLFVSNKPTESTEAFVRAHCPD
jgi:hypothetical protein